MKAWIQVAIALASSDFWASAHLHGIVKRQSSSNTATVDLSKQNGAPQHLASGFIYGIPDAANEVPSRFYTNMGFKATRAGGSQLPAPARGWVYGQTEFQVITAAIYFRKWY